MASYTLTHTGQEIDNAVEKAIKVYAKASGSSWNSLSALIYGINWDNGM